MRLKSLSVKAHALISEPRKILWGSVQAVPPNYSEDIWEKCFTSSGYASILRYYYEQDHILLLERLSNKRISHDLTKLYAMGFLSRIKMARKTKGETRVIAMFMGWAERG